MSRRPLLLQCLPKRIQASLVARYYRNRTARWRNLYDAAELHFAPGTRMRLLPGDVISDDIAFTGVYELAVTRRVVQLARTGGLMVDVGANIGYYALLWCGLNPNNRCIAFEASPRNIEMLRENVKRNGFESRIEVVPHAAGKERGTLQFEVGPTAQTGWGGFATSQSESTINVDVVRIDEIVPAGESVALMKVDIEGADTWALMGCERLLRARSVKELLCEHNKPRARAIGIQDDELTGYLRSVGYQLTPLNDPRSDMVEWSAVPAT